jgi:rare lipoprotein A
MIARALVCSLVALWARPAVAPPSGPRPDPPPTTLMVASWYGPKHHGRITASGERFDMYALTAAHRYLPFGTPVSCSVAGRSVVVRINDRGPYVRRKGHYTRDLDLSMAAANRLGYLAHGEAVLEVQILTPERSSHGRP